MKKAICFGTNYVGTPNELSWCVKDAQDWTTFLKNRGFVVKTILEEQVNRVSFLDGLRKLVTESVMGDVLVCTESGHGTRKYTQAEEDFYDEALYFTDGLVLDDDVREILDLLPDNVELFLFFDSCHSGGMMRIRGVDKIRYIQPDFVIPRAKKRKSLTPELPGKEIYISGCLSDEYSYDAGALRNGAATYYALHSYNTNDTYQKWYDKIRTFLPSDNYPQTPVLSANEFNIQKIAFKEPVISGIPNIPSSDPPVNETLKKNWLILLLEKLINWLKNIWTYIIK